MAIEARQDRVIEDKARPDKTRQGNQPHDNRPDKARQARQARSKKTEDKGDKQPMK